ncbi:hypothetical protein CL673_03300 [Candidatus Bathyarchaeota archaeon]|nr:hypothetical protein [Candidatus Bathyarchaeota archaeon]
MALSEAQQKFRDVLAYPLSLSLFPPVITVMSPRLRVPVDLYGVSPDPSLDPVPRVEVNI